MSRWRACEVGQDDDSEDASQLAIEDRLCSLFRGRIEGLPSNHEDTSHGRFGNWMRSERDWSNSRTEREREYERFDAQVETQR